MSRAAEIPSANGECSVFGCSRTILRTMRQHLLAAFDGLLYGCGDAVIGVNPATDSVAGSFGNSFCAGSADFGDSDIRRRLVAWRMSRRSSNVWSAEHRSICFFNLLRARKSANTSFGINLALIREGRERILEHHRSRERFLGRGQRDVFRDRPGERAFGRGPPRSRPTDARSARLRRRAGFDPFFVNSVVGFYRSGVFVR